MLGTVLGANDEAVQQVLDLLLVDYKHFRDVLRYEVMPLQAMNVLPCRRWPAAPPHHTCAQRHHTTLTTSRTDFSR